MAVLVDNRMRNAFMLAGGLGFGGARRFGVVVHVDDGFLAVGVHDGTGW